MLIEEIQSKLNKRKSASLYRDRKVINRADKNKVYISGNTCIDFSNNDYLGLKKHPSVIEALSKACQKHGFGSGASPFISGYSALHQEVEGEFAQWLGVDSAILFNSGYSANIGIISALSKRSDTLFSDKLCHASILDGITLSRTKHVRYQHNCPKHFKKIAKKNSPDLIVTESIFSMEGDIAPISDLTQLAKQHHSGLIIDDAHGVGVLGKTGKGVSEHFSLKQADYTCLVMPLGKAFNAMGAMVAGKKEIIDTVLQYSKSYCYSTALPPAVCFGIKTTLDLIKKETWRQQQLLQNISLFKNYAFQKGLTLHSNDQTPIRSILVKGNKQALFLQKWLLSKGFYVSAVRPPTVPRNKARLRLSINALHRQDQITQLIDYIIAGLKYAETKF
jgi:8-amino-7-oxononanoate synthase